MACIVMAPQRPVALPLVHLYSYGLYSYGPPASTYTDLARRRRRRRRLTGRADGLLCAGARRVAVAGCVALLEPFDLELQRRHVRLELPTITVQAIATKAKTIWAIAIKTIAIKTIAIKAIPMLATTM